MSPTD